MSAHPPDIYGIAAEFEDSESLMHAAEQARARGYTQLEGYAPFPVEGLPQACGHPKNRIPLIMFGAGIVGAAGGYFMQWYSAVIRYPMNVGGRPLHSWPSFVPLTFELMVLFASVAGFIAMLMLNGFPRPFHPIFNTKNFERASQDRFFLCIQSIDEKFDSEEVRSFLESTGAVHVSEVPNE